MDGQVKLGDIINLVNALRESGMSIQEIRNLPIYVSDDDELNGAHAAWRHGLIDANDEECSDIVELINENSCNPKLDGKAIFIG